MKEKSTLTKVYARPTKATMPTLLKFQNGRLSAIHKENTQYSRLRSTQKNVKASSAQETAMVVANGQIYHGQIQRAGTADEQQSLTSNYIAVRNKTTNKVRLIPMEQVRLNNDIYKKLVDAAQPTALSDETKRVMLMKQFGGRRAQRYLSKKEDMKLNIDVVQNDLENTIAETTIMEDSPHEGGEEHLTFIRPVFNKDATKLADIYDLKDLVPEELLDRLEEEAKVVLATAVEQLPIKSEYLRKCIEQRQAAKTASVENLLHIKLIIYMDSLLHVIKSRARSLAKVELSGISEKVENDVRQRFSGAKGRRTASSIEKALCHFIVLAALIDPNYQVEISALSQEVLATRVKVVKYAQICNLLIKKGRDVLTLCLPSTVPPLPVKFIKMPRKQ